MALIGNKLNHPFGGKGKEKEMKITKKMAKQFAKAMREAMDEAEDNRVLGNKELAYYYNGRKSAFEYILRSAEGDYTLTEDSWGKLFVD